MFDDSLIVTPDEKNRLQRERWANDSSYREKRLENQRKWYNNQKINNPNFLKDRNTNRSVWYRTQEGWAKSKLRDMKSRAEKYSIPFDFDIGQLLYLRNRFTHCTCCGCELDYSGKIKKRGHSPTSASVDRIKPSQGYVKNNCIIICTRCNTLKNNASSKELLQVYNFVKLLEDGKIDV